MTKKMILLMLAVLMTASAFCQESDSKKINKIKRNTQYLYAEATMKDSQEAYDVALELLNGYIDEYVKSKKKYEDSNNIIIKNVGSKLERIQMKRGQLTRIFLYVKKSDIIPADNSTIRENAGKKAPGTLTSKIEEIEETPEQNTALRLSVAWQQEVIDQLLKCKSLIEAKALLNRQKVEHRIQKYGAPDSARKKADCFWVIGDSNGSLITVLGMGNNERTNFKTLELDCLENYPEATAIWFIMSK